MMAAGGRDPVMYMRAYKVGYLKEIIVTKMPLSTWTSNATPRLVHIGKRYHYRSCDQSYNLYEWSSLEWWHWSSRRILTSSASSITLYIHLFLIWKKNTRKLLLVVVNLFLTFYFIPAFIVTKYIISTHFTDWFVYKKNRLYVGVQNYKTTLVMVIIKVVTLHRFSNNINYINGC